MNNSSNILSMNKSFNSIPKYRSIFKKIEFNYLFNESGVFQLIRTRSTIVST